MCLGSESSALGQRAQVRRARGGSNVLREAAPSMTGGGRLLRTRRRHEVETMEKSAEQSDSEQEACNAQRSMRVQLTGKWVREGWLDF